MPAINHFDFLVLRLVSTEECHGHRLRQKAHLVSRDRPVAASSVYRSLHKLERLGLLECRLTRQEKAPARKVFACTVSGRHLSETAYGRYRYQVSLAALRLERELSDTQWILDALDAFTPRRASGTQPRTPF